MSLSRLKSFTLALTISEWTNVQPLESAAISVLFESKRKWASFDLNWVYTNELLSSNEQMIVFECK